MRIKSIRTKVNKNRILSISVSPSELRTIKKLAQKYAGGNVSAWIRYCAINYKPKKHEVSDD